MDRRGADDKQAFLVVFFKATQEVKSRRTRGTGRKRQRTEVTMNYDPSYGGRGGSIVTTGESETTVDICPDIYSPAIDYILKVPVTKTVLGFKRTITRDRVLGISVIIPAQVARRAISFYCSVQSVPLTKMLQISDLVC